MWGSAVMLRGNAVIHHNVNIRYYEPDMQSKGSSIVGPNVTAISLIICLDQILNICQVRQRFTANGPQRVGRAGSRSYCGLAEVTLWYALHRKVLEVFRHYCQGSLQWHALGDANAGGLQQCLSNCDIHQRRVTDDLMWKRLTVFSPLSLIW